MQENMENGTGTEETSATEYQEGVKGWALRGIFETLMRVQGNLPGRDRFTALGQSHLDAAWMWRVFQTRSKAKYTFRNALRHIDQHDFFYFTQSQSVYYEWMKDRQPRIFRAIQDNVKRGRWELTGGMWVEPDCNIPDGESLVRQRLYGQRFYLDHFGRLAETEWLPDTFGFCWTLPQILAKSGCKYFWTTKLLWNDTNKFPLRSFMWQSPDGSQILTHISPFFGMNAGDFFQKLSFNRALKEGIKLTANYRTNPFKIQDSLDKQPIPEVLIAYGMGDGGGGPNETEIEVVRTLRKSSTIDTGTAGQFFRRLEKYRDRLPVWNDELYLEYHRGCYTTQSRVKRANRRLEIALRDTEIIHSMNSLFGDAYPEDELRDGWKTLCFNQFHDILPGSSIPEVYEDAHDEYERLEAMCDDLAADGLRSIARRIGTDNPALADYAPLVAFNTLSWPRTGFVRLEAQPGRTIHVFSADGARVPSQPVQWGDRNYVLFVARDIPTLGYRTYYASEEKLPAAPDTAPAHEAPLPENFSAVSAEQLPGGSCLLENEFLKVTVDAATGWVSSIVDKINQREMLDGPANQLKLYRDASVMYPAWNIDSAYKSKPIKIPEAPESVEIIESGPVACAVAVERALRRSTVRQEIRLLAGRPMVYFVTIVDWHETKAILKTYFDTAITADYVTSEIAYGAIDRATKPRTKWDRGRWEMNCHKWLSMSDGRYGVALLNDGKYGFSAEGKTLALTLLRGPSYPPPIINAWGLSEPVADRPKYTDQGRHVIRYAFMPHGGDWRDANVWRYGQEFNTPITTARTSHHEGMMPAESTSLAIEAATSYVSAIKRPEDNPGRAVARYHQLVVRLVEAAGAGDTVRLTFRGPNLSIEDVREMDLLEFGSTPTGSVEAGTVTLQMKPHEIKTIRITLSVGAEKE